MQRLVIALIDILMVAMIWLILAPFQIWIASALTYQDQEFMITVMLYFAIPAAFALYYGGHIIARRPTFGREILSLFNLPVKP